MLKVEAILRYTVQLFVLPNLEVCASWIFEYLGDDGHQLKDV